MNPSWPSGFGQGSHASPEKVKKRRGELLSDDEIKSDISQSPFRVGWPELTPLPTDTRGIANAEQYIHDYDAIRSELQNVLLTQQVRVIYLRLVLRKTIGGTSPPHPTVLVEATDMESGSWYHAVLRMVRKIQDAQANRQEFIAVEIIEQSFLRPQVHPIQQGHHLLPAWETKIAPAVINHLRKNEAAWSLLSLVKLAAPSSGKEPRTTVLLDVCDAEAAQWQRLTQNLRQMVLDYRCDVEVWQAQPLTSTDPGSGRLPQRMWEPTMRMGNGIAPTGDICVGTLGGFITLKKPDGTCTPYILTNFHVIRDSPNLRGLLAPNPPNEALTHFVFPKTPSAHKISVPADADTDRKKQWIQKHIDVKRRQIYGTGEDLRAQKPTIGQRAQWGEEQAIKAVEAAEAVIAGYEKTLHDMSDKTKYHAGTLKAVLGHTFASKGNKRLPLDWALVAIDEKRQYDLSFPYEDIDKEEMMEWPWIGSELSRWTDIPASRKIEEVCKVGRMTGWTTGHINYAEAYMDLTEEAGEDFFPSYKTVVSCIRVESSYGGKSAFAERGDSGSLVLDAATGACCGLLFGSNPVVGCGLMTEAGVLFRSIEEVTGCKVVAPVRLT